MTDMITPVILSGGAGTRLWPLSRAEQPKQLLPLTATDTMLQVTAGRTRDPRYGRPVVVAGASHADAVEEQLRSADVALDALILERKNIGGNAFLTETIENHPGFTKIAGPELMERKADCRLRAIAQVASATGEGVIASYGVRAYLKR